MAAREDSRAHRAREGARGDSRAAVDTAVVAAAGIGVGVETAGRRRLERGPSA